MDFELHLTLQGASQSVTKCGMTKSDFAAIPFEMAPAGQTAVFEIRNATETGFEGMDIFDGVSSGWFRYVKKTDPYGFF